MNGDAELVIVPDVGHTPNLEEPEASPRWTGCWHGFWLA